MAPIPRRKNTSRDTGSSPSMAQEIRAQLTADQHERDRVAADRQSQRADSEAAWRASAPVLDQLAVEVAATCRELGCRYDLRRVFRRGWVFWVSSRVRSAKGFGEAGKTTVVKCVLFKPDGSWQVVSSGDGAPVKDPGAGWWPAVEPFDIEQARGRVKQQIAERARGIAWRWGRDLPISYD